MELNKRMELIRQVGEEIITEEELEQLLSEKKKIIAYDGFEPSGNVHIAQGVMRAINVSKMIKAGIHFKMLVADWHGWANNKMQGDLDKIQTTGKYMIEVWKASGLDVGKVEFVWANDIVVERSYWKKVMQIARNSTIKRIIRCGQIMGRKESSVLQASQILYPCMQAADIFHLEADIAQLGLDQRKVNVLARELAPRLGYNKPVIVSHHMLLGLGKPASNEKNAVERAIDLKMSKSKPDSAIFMTDRFEDIKRKIRKAYCPEKTAHENPVLEYMKYIVFEKFSKVTVERDKKFGGDIQYDSYSDLEKDFLLGELHPADLKNAAALYIDKIIKPVREYFEKNAKAKELLEKVNSYKITR